jgi:hypothetical protein
LRSAAAILLLAVTLVGCVAPQRSYWLPNTIPIERLDFDTWDALLRQHVREGGVDYPAFATSQRFREFLEMLRTTRFTRETPRELRLATWINAYNAFAIDGILQGLSPATLLGRWRFFWRQRYAVAGEEITLWDLENHRIRPLGDPRIHFALVCASRSCPKLASEAYVPQRLEQQLQAQARAFVNDPARNRFDAGAGVAELSDIFRRHDEDFVAVAGSVPAYVARFVDDPVAAEALAAGRWKVRYRDHDWSLNGAPAAAP